MNEFSTSCPVCTQPLELKDGYYICGGHYKIGKDIFEEAWKKFNRKRKPKQGDIDDLMEIVIAGNEAENAPKINWKL